MASRGATVPMSAARGQVEAIGSGLGGHDWMAKLTVAVAHSSGREERFGGHGDHAQHAEGNLTAWPRRLSFSNS
jgi:hypothetical protein